MNEIRIKEDYAEVIIKSPKYGIFTVLISIEDVERVSGYSWSIHPQNGKCKEKMFYYPSSYNCLPYRLLHRYIMDAPKGLYVDHINHNTLDNRRENLRICTPSENKFNSEQYLTNSSGEKGVFFDYFIPTPKWKAFIKYKYKMIHIGYYDTFEEAVIARKDKEKELFGDYACVTNEA